MSPHDDLSARLHASPLAPHTDAILRTALPTVRLISTPGRAELGESRFGGTPDLPDDFGWPNSGPLIRLGGFTLGQPQSLPFLAQVCLNDVPDAVALGLPPAGWLLVFFEHVYYVSANATLERRPTPPRVEFGEYQETRVTLVPALSLPIVEAYGFPELLKAALARDKLEEAYFEFLLSHEMTDDGHRLGGHAFPVHADVRYECEAAASRPKSFLSWRRPSGDDPAFVEKALEWKLLLQFGESARNTAPGFMWGDGASLYFMLRDADLRSRAFDKTRMILQSG